MMKKLFITGFDQSSSWMYDWFMENFLKHSKLPIHVYDFDKFQAPINDQRNWFKKPFAMLNAATKAEKVCWIDIDCHVKASPDKIFNFTSKNQLTMAEDRPWTTRRGQKWHNSGVVAFQGEPRILQEWAFKITLNETETGDQEVLHSMMTDDLKRLTYITDLPREYNTLRIDLLDSTAPKDIKIMHWTGGKGKEVIRGMING